MLAAAPRKLCGAPRGRVAPSAGASTQAKPTRGRMGGSQAGLWGRVRAPAAQPTARLHSTWNLRDGGHLSTRKIGPEGGDRPRILSTALLPPPSTPRQQNSKTGEKMDKTGTGSVLSTSRLVGGALTSADYFHRLRYPRPLRCGSLGVRKGVRLSGGPSGGPPWKKTDSPFVSSDSRMGARFSRLTRRRRGEGGGEGKQEEEGSKLRRRFW